jgi:hypothetical protein
MVVDHFQFLSARANRTEGHRYADCDSYAGMLAAGVNQSV